MSATSPTRPDPVRMALEAAAGRREATSVDSRLLAWAHELREARAGVRSSEPCPEAVLHRVRAIPAERGRSAPGVLLRLVFDSWRDLAPAVRGGRPPRTLRFTAGEDALDLRLVHEEDGGLLVQVATEPERAGLRASVETGGRRAVAETLDSTGAGQIRLAGSVREMVVTVLDEDRPLMRSPPVRLE